MTCTGLLWACTEASVLPPGGGGALSHSPYFSSMYLPPFARQSASVWRGFFPPGP
jgi:hypothetical protein